jgi:hypothetical protein
MTLAFDQKQSKVIIDDNKAKKISKTIFNFHEYAAL